MSKVRIHARMPDNLLLKDVYGAPMQLGMHGETSAAFAEGAADGGDRITLTGTHFSYRHGALVGGTVESVAFLDAEGKAYAIFGDLHLDMADVPDPTADSGFDAGAFTHLALKGDDRVVGSAADDLVYALGGDDIVFAGNGSDWVNGGHGNDTLTGGRGDDFFESGTGGGRDVITDFDAKGGAGKQDFLSLDASAWMAHQSGDDVVVEFGHGDSVRLLDTQRSDISDADIFLTFEG